MPFNVDYLTVGPCPADEDCAQVGDENFRARATKEMNAYINQLYRQFPEAEDVSVVFQKKWFPHDFGTYGEVAVVFIEDDEKSRDFAINVEWNLPSNWDDEALDELNGE